MVNVLDQFLDDNYEDVLRTSNIKTNFSISTSNNNEVGKASLPLSWIVPDGTNRTLEEISDKKVSNGTSQEEDKQAQLSSNYKGWSLITELSSS